MKTTGGVDDISEGSEVHSYLAEDDTQSMWDSDQEAHKEKEKEDLYALVRSVVVKKKCYTLGTLSKEFPHISPSILQGMTAHSPS